MPIQTLTLEGSGVTLNLDALLTGQDGAQAVAGITGFGLPPVSVLWSEGVGDGARYRGRRVLPRDIDLPLTFTSASRAALKAFIRDLSIVLSGEAILRVTEGSASRSVKVVRTGGGDVVQGEDSDGRTWLKTVVTLRAGSPFWESSETVQADFSFDSTVSTTNPGTADAAPVWTITGPALGFTLRRGDDAIRFLEFIGKGKKVVVDTRDYTVRDETGTSRYTGLGEAPRFFHLPPGETSWTVEADQSSPAYLAKVGSPRRNFIAAPDGRSSTGWALNGAWSRNAASERFQISNWQGLNPPGSAAMATLAGLTVGQTYLVELDMTNTETAWAKTSPSTGPATMDGTTPASVEIHGIRPQPTKVDVAFGASRVSFTFVADAESVTLRVLPTIARWTVGSGKMYRSHAATFDNVFVGEPGVPFTGDTPANADYAYAWTGTTGASQSVETPRATDPSGSGIRLEFYPREWIVA